MNKYDYVKENIESQKTRIKRDYKNLKESVLGKRLVKEVRLVTLKKIFRKIEKICGIINFCDCEKWCTCWEEFKKKELKQS